LFLILFWMLGMVSQHLTAMLVICCYSVGQKNLYGNLLNRSNHNKVLIQKLLFYLVAFEFLVKVSNIYTAFSCNDIESRFFTLEICTILSLENFYRKPKCVFSQIFWKKKLKAYPWFGNWQVKNLSKNLGNKQVCKKSAKSLQKKSAYSKVATTSLQNKKSKSAKKVCIFKNG